MAYCLQRRAFLLIDPPPEIDDVPSAMDWKSVGLEVARQEWRRLFSAPETG